MRGTSAAANRTRLAFIALLALLAAAVFLIVRFGWAKSWGWWQPDPSSPVVTFTRDWRGDRASWILLGVGVLLIIWGLWWLLRQIPHSVGTSTYGLSHDGDGGSSSVTTDALSKAVVADLEQIHGVTSAGVKFLGARTSPELLVEIEIDDRAEPRAVLDAVETDVLPDLERCLGHELTHAGIKVYTTAASRPSVDQMEIAPAQPVGSESPAQGGSTEGLPDHPMPRPTFLGGRDDAARPRTSAGAPLS